METPTLISSQLLADLDLEENRDARSALRELKALLMTKQDEIRVAALELLRAMSLFGESPQDTAKPKKKKKQSRYEDASHHFRFQTERWRHRRIIR